MALGFHMENAWEEKRSGKGAPEELLLGRRERGHDLHSTIWLIAIENSLDLPESSRKFFNFFYFCVKKKEFRPLHFGLCRLGFAMQNNGNVHYLCTWTPAL